MSRSPPFAVQATSNINVSWRHQFDTKGFLQFDSGQGSGARRNRFDEWFIRFNPATNRKVLFDDVILNNPCAFSRVALLAFKRCQMCNLSVFDYRVRTRGGISFILLIITRKKSFSSLECFRNSRNSSLKLYPRNLFFRPLSDHLIDIYIYIRARLLDILIRDTRMRNSLCVSLARIQYISARYATPTFSFLWFLDRD